MKKIFIALLIITLTCSLSIAQDSWTHLTEINGQEIGYVTDIEFDSNGDIWISALGAKLFYFTENQWYNKSDQIGKTITDIASAPSGEVWFCNDSNLVRYNGTDWIQIDTPYRASNISIDKNNVVWCSTIGGIYRYTDSIWTRYTIEDGLIQNHVSCVTVSPENIPWCIYGDAYTQEGQSYAGVSYLNGDTWISYNETNGLLSNRVNDVAFSSDGSVYVSCLHSGISIYNGSYWADIASKSGMLIIDTSEDIWVNAWHLGNYIYELKGSIWQEHYLDTFVAINSKYSIDHENKVWIGSNDGILILDPTSTAVEEKNEQKVIPLLQNYPNPFNAKTTISFSLQNAGYTTLNVYSIIGRKVATLVDEQMVAGDHAVVFDGTDFGSGMYISKISINGTASSNQMLLIK